MENTMNTDSLILLVGSNPLPNYLAAIALKPSKIHLVHSKETEAPKNRLVCALRDDLDSSVIINGDAFVGDPFCALAVGDKIRDLIATCHPAHLHYTGGTKVMSAHALKVFYENNGSPENASYLDEVQRCLRFDGNLPNRSLSECGVTLTFNRVLQLHGLAHKNRSSVNGGPSLNDSLEIATAVLKRPQLASCLYGEMKRLDLSEAKETPFIANYHGLELSVPIIPPKEGMNTKCFGAWRKFLGGEWLEVWIATKIEEIGLAGKPQINVGVNCSRVGTERQFEVDVAFIHGHRSYFISCTTDMTMGICKSKAFEILTRSRQMGGDLARAALVSLLSCDAVTELQKDVADAWGSANATHIFGLEDLKTWIGIYGSPNLDSIKKWIDS